MQWDGSAHSNRPHPRQLPIPSSEAVRTAALQASWRRDRRVARRRIAWRWIAWYAQRYLPALLALLALLAIGSYLAGWVPAMPRFDGRPAEAVAAAHVHPIAPAEPAAKANDTPLTLRVSRQFEPHEALPAALDEAQTSADTLTLTTENWLHSKEP